MNGHPPHPLGQQQPHILGQQQEAARQAIAQQIAQLTASIYTRAAADSLTLQPGEEWQAAEPDAAWPAAAHFRELAKASHEASKAYFEGLGLVQFNSPEENKT